MIKRTYQIPIPGMLFASRVIIREGSIPTEIETSIIRNAIDAQNRKLFIIQTLDAMEKDTLNKIEQLRKALEL